MGQNIGSWFKGAIDTVSGWFSGKGSSSTSTGAGAGAKPGDDKPFNFGRLAGGGIGLVLGWLVGNGMIGGLFGKIAGVGMAILGMMVGGPAVEKLFGGGDATAKTNTPGKSPTANTHALNNQPAPAPGNNQPTTSPNVLSPEEAHRIYEYAQHLREYAANHQQQSGTDPNPGNVTYVANPNFRPNQRV